MGPQLVRCGMRRPRTRGGWCGRCFNGAATCSLRNDGCAIIAGDVHAWLQWGRNLFVAECKASQSMTPRGILASMGPQLVRCGMLRQNPRLYRPSDASMGPQLVRCGMVGSFFAAGVFCLCFNGAATCSLRNDDLDVQGAGCRSSFNGAATCSLRNVTWSMM